MSAASSGPDDNASPAANKQAGAARGRDRSETPPDLKAALRVARNESAERGDALAGLEELALARLELLRDRLEPVLAQVPEEVDLFDLAMMPGAHPRLFVDMVGFVEIAADRRRYRFVQDTRGGRVVLAESDDAATIARAVTAYVARRLVERERVLPSAQPAERWIGPVPWARLAPLNSRTSGIGRIVLEHLGVVALVVLLWVLGGALYHWFAGPPG